MADGFTDEQLGFAIRGALEIAPLDTSFIPDAIFIFDTNPEDDPNYEIGAPHPWASEKAFSSQMNYDDRAMTPGLPGEFTNASELRFTNDEMEPVTITHLMIEYNAMTKRFTIELTTPVTVAAGGTFRRYPGTIIAKVTR